MALIAKMEATEVIARAGGRYIESEADHPDARELAAYANGLSGGAPAWLREAEHVRYDQHAQREESVTLTAVHAASEDDPNKEWAEASPQGSLQLTIQNPGAFGFVKPGKFYYVEIREVRGPRE